MLTVKRKADRLKMAEIIQGIAFKYGCTVIFDESPLMGKRAINMKIEHPSGLAVHMAFNGASSQPDTFVLPWHFSTYADEDGDKRLSAAMGWTAGGTVNSAHGRKCTAVRKDFDALAKSIDEVLAMASDGSAFL